MVTCATCARSSIPADKMGAAGWLHCQHEGTHEYRSPAAACSFEPSRWQPKKEGKN